MKKPFKRPVVRRRPVKTTEFITSKSELVAPPPIPAHKRLIYKPEVIARVGVTYVSLWRWMQNGRFPASRIIGGQIAWLESEIDDWMESRPKREYRKPAEVA